MAPSDNPCMTCAVDQKCCRDMGLKLSREEYERHFQEHSDRLSVVRYGGMVLVFPGDDRPCPYLTDTGCSIYADRPVDCRLYPFELNRMVDRGDRVEAFLYDQTDCPHREHLFISLEEARPLLEELAREVFGPGKQVRLVYEPGKKPRRATGPLNRLVSRISHAIRSRR